MRKRSDSNSYSDLWCHGLVDCRKIRRKGLYQGRLGPLEMQPVVEKFEIDEIDAWNSVSAIGCSVYIHDVGTWEEPFQFQFFRVSLLRRVSFFTNKSQEIKAGWCRQNFDFSRISLVFRCVYKLSSAFLLICIELKGKKRRKISVVGTLSVEDLWSSSVCADTNGSQRPTTGFPNRLIRSQWRLEKCSCQWIEYLESIGFKESRDSYQFRCRICSESGW
jgi:hypothetical protein